MMKVRVGVEERKRDEPSCGPGFSVSRCGAVMGIYDREYYRGETSGSAWFSGAAPVCKWIIVINILVFLLQNAFSDNKGDIYYWLAASPGTLKHFRIWQLLTSTFLHDGILHILGNMLFLWIVGRDMESLYGSRDFLIFYLAAGMVATLVWVLIALAGHRDGFVIGASGAVMGVVTLYTLYYPTREIIFYFVPMPIWLVLVIFLFFPLLSLNDHGVTRIAWQSHMAGTGFGWAFKQFDLRWSRLVSGRVGRPRLRIFSPVGKGQSRSRSSTPSWTAAGTSPSVGGKGGSVSVLPEEQLDARLDEVLAKIAREGRGGLTEEELRVLQEASRRARIRRSDRP
jgi:membrane associated rhomboid family serine protease